MSEEIDELRNRSEVLQREAGKRRSLALTKVSAICADILRADLERQAEFLLAKQVEFDFRNDSIAVDGALNFAESSNVYLKNSAILGVFLAAGNGCKFFPSKVCVD